MYSPSVIISTGMWLHLGVCIFCCFHLQISIEPGKSPQLLSIGLCILSCFASGTFCEGFFFVFKGIVQDVDFEPKVVVHNYEHF